MVSMSAAVSPKYALEGESYHPLRQLLFRAFSLRLMSLNCLLTSRDIFGELHIARKKRRGERRSGFPSQKPGRDESSCSRLRASLDWPSDKLLDLLRRTAIHEQNATATLTGCQGPPLGHAVVSKPTPLRPPEQHPLNLRVLHENLVPCGLSRFVLSFLYAMESLLKESLGWGRHPSKVEHLRRPSLGPRVELLQPQLNCHGSFPLDLRKLATSLRPILAAPSRKVIGFRRERHDGAQ